jgi:pimeloyl-ACP methyl ester carboxylesterase
VNTDRESDSQKSPAAGAEPYRPYVDAELELRDGRTLGYALWGSPDGHAALLCHGSPGSRLFTPDPVVTAKLGLRLITIDRPGYGRSSGQPERRFVDWPADVSQLMESLGVDSFSIVAHSSGGPYALACAATMKIRRVVLVSCVAPAESQHSKGDLAVDEGDQELADLARTDPERARAMVAASVSWLADAPDRFLLLPRPEPDAALLEDPQIKMMFTATVRDAVRQGLGGYAADEVLCLQPWGLPLDQLDSDISIWHGMQDRAVPISDAHKLARLLNTDQVHIEPDQGHGLILARWPAIAAELLP